MKGLRTLLARSIVAALLLVALAGHVASADTAWRAPGSTSPQLLTPVDPGYPQ